MSILPQQTERIEEMHLHITIRSSNYPTIGEESENSVFPCLIDTVVDGALKDDITMEVIHAVTFGIVCFCDVNRDTHPTPTGGALLY